MNVKEFISYLKYNPSIIIKQYRDFPYERDVIVDTTTVGDARINKTFQKDFYDKEIDSIYLGDGINPRNQKYIEGIVISLAEKWKGQPWE